VYFGLGSARLNDAAIEVILKARVEG